MKKLNIILILILSLFITTNVNAVGINVSKTSVYVGDTFTASFTLTTAAWDVSISASGPVSGCSLHEVNDSGTGYNTTKTFSVNCTATGIGNITISASGNHTPDTEDNSIPVTGSVTVSAVAKPITPSTDTNTTNTNSNSGSSTASSNSNNNSSSSQNNNQNTQTKNETTEVKNNASLKAITISSGTIEFNKDTLEYTVNVDDDVKTFEVKAEAEDSKATVKVDGDKELKAGNNVYTITVTAQDGTVKTYKITVVKKELSDNTKIKKLTVANYKLGFKDGKDKYKLLISNEDNLTIDVELEDEKATYEIVGNKNLVDGSIIKIKVTAENGDTKTYTINISKNTTKTNNTLLYVSLGFNILFIITAFVMFIIKKRKQKKNEFVIDNAPSESIPENSFEDNNTINENNK